MSFSCAIVNQVVGLENFEVKTLNVICFVLSVDNPTWSLENRDEISLFKALKVSLVWVNLESAT